MGVSIRSALATDAPAVFTLARAFATSFAVDEPAFQHVYLELLETPAAYLALAVADTQVQGYLLGFDHPTFFANGHVAWVEELMVAERVRGQGIGAALMHAFEDWARARGNTLVALATRRAAPFYQAIGYEESANYFRKLL